MVVPNGTEISAWELGFKILPTVDLSCNEYKVDQMIDVSVDILTFVVFYRGLYLNFRHFKCFQRVNTSSDVHAVILENLNDCVILIAVGKKHTQTQSVPNETS